jgi:hypothetical protein
MLSTRTFKKIDRPEDRFQVRASSEKATQFSIAGDKSFLCGFHYKNAKNEFFVSWAGLAALTQVHHRRKATAKVISRRGAQSNCFALWRTAMDRQVTRGLWRIFSGKKMRSQPCSRVRKACTVIGVPRPTHTPWPVSAVAQQCGGMAREDQRTLGEGGLHPLHLATHKREGAYAKSTNHQWRQGVCSWRTANMADTNPCSHLMSSGF